MPNDRANIKVWLPGQRLQGPRATDGRDAQQNEQEQGAHQICGRESLRSGGVARLNDTNSASWQLLRRSHLPTRRDSLLLGRRRDFLVLGALDGSGAEFGLALAAAE